MADGVKSSSEGMSAATSVEADDVSLWLRRASELKPHIEAAAGEIEKSGCLPVELLQAYHQRQLFRMLLPKSIGGGEVPLTTFIQVIEALAGADASAAWVVAQGSGCSMAAAYLAPEVAREVFGADDAVAAWGPPSQTGSAHAVEDGYRINGKWHFASGNRHSRWMAANSIVTEADGKPRLGPAGSPVPHTFLFKRENATTADDWQVMGLKGTGSDSYEVDNLFVPKSHVFIRDAEPFRREFGPLYRFKNLSIYGLGVAATSLGIARAMLGEFITVAKTKIERTTGKPMCESTAIQARIAEAEAKLQSSRLFLLTSVDELHQAAVAGQEFTLEARTRLRLATTWTAQQSREIAEFAFLTAGTNAIFESGPFERRFRDIHTLTQQVQAHASNFDLVGQSLLGLPMNSRLI